MASDNALGEYLRARRELVDPADAGVRVTGVRRTPGLRREEVATLAGISADYYLRLEQGRDRNPSAQVLQAIAQVLGLDATATDYLLGLTGARSATTPRTTRRETAPAGVRMLLQSLSLPAFVENRVFEVVDTNLLAQRLFPGLVLGQNRLRAMFLDPAERAMQPDWEQAMAGMVASFRSSIGTDTADPRITKLVGELSLESETFRRLWARHDVRPLSGAPARMQHPDVGLLELHREKLLLDGTDGQLLVIYHAEPGSESERALALLGSLAATQGAESAESAQQTQQTQPR